MIEPKKPKYVHYFWITFFSIGVVLFSLNVALGLFQRNFTIKDVLYIFLALGFAGNLIKEIKSKDKYQ